MSEYYMTDRDMKGYCNSGRYEDLKRALDEHVANGWRHRDCVIVDTKMRRIGTNIRTCYFPDINAFWPPKKDKYSPRVEIFGWSILVEPVMHDFYHSVVYDPLGVFPKGMLCADIEKAAKRGKSPEASNAT